MSLHIVDQLLEFSAPSAVAGQLAVRLAVLLVFGLVALASSLGLDLLLYGGSAIYAGVLALVASGTQWGWARFAVWGYGLALLATLVARKRARKLLRWRASILASAAMLLIRH